MTSEEESQLVTWLNKCGDIGKPVKDLAGITTKVRAIIKGRRIWNSHRKNEVEIVPLSKAEDMQMVSWASNLSKTWESNFHARHATTLDKKHAKTAELRRASKQTEAVVGWHFYAEFGLRRELIDAGIMNPITNVIRDPRRSPPRRWRGPAARRRSASTCARPRAWHQAATRPWWPSSRACELHEHNRSKPPKFRKIFDPSAEGLLPIPERVVRQPADAEHTRLDSHFGSMSLHNIAQQKAERRDAQAAV
ncbi:hypothetical protein T492DRAFT_1064149 [Pavlovales sp. CCMP2436]|nr:hypothetical protein T492DRAFT_1064149 [Pavlovales sp. CCMP2436]